MMTNYSVWLFIFLFLLKESISDVIEAFGVIVPKVIKRIPACIVKTSFVVEIRRINDYQFLGFEIIRKFP
jgi:hypothetical protein